MFPPPTGPSPSPEQIRELDDSLFSSDPHGYFMARIESLIAYADGARADHTSGLGGQFAKRLRWVRESELLPTSADARKLQIAIDAMTLRQHVAEAVARLWLALLRTRTAEPGSVSVWEALTSTPPSNVQVFKAIQGCDSWNDPSVALELLLPERLWPQFHSDPNTRRAVEVLCQWLEHTAKVLTRTDIHVAAANNKYKHGLAVRPRLDERISFLSVDDVPADGEEIPISAMAHDVPIFDVPFVEYLAKPPRDTDGEHGLELTRLRLATPALLVEATMLATLYGALFHVAAAKHARWSDTVGEIAAYPSLPLGPTPTRLLGKAVTGMRSPVTFRPDGRPPVRGHAVGFEHGELVSLEVDYRRRRRMTLTDDGSQPSTAPEREPGGPYRRRVQVWIRRWTRRSAPRGGRP